jgi:hypothetical protein
MYRSVPSKRLWLLPSIMVTLQTLPQL